MEEKPDHHAVCSEWERKVPFLFILQYIFKKVHKKTSIYKKMFIRIEGREVTEVFAIIEVCEFHRESVPPDDSARLFI